MRCFTDDELVRGLDAVIYTNSDVGPLQSNEQNLATFLEAAQPPTDARVHPQYCRRCGRALSTAEGTALVAISIVEREWRCAPCAAG